MNILFLMIAYPDVQKNSSMYTDLAIEFAKNGHQVFVAVANGPGESGLNTEGGIIVLRIRTMELFNTSFIKKGIANVLLPFQVTRGIGKYLKDKQFDAVIVSTPPITYLNTVHKLKRKFNLKVYLILRDIFPQNAVDLGILKNRLIIKYFRRKEAKLYGISDQIGCMSAGNVNYVIEHNQGVEPGKLHILPNWKNVKEKVSPDKDLRRDLGLEGKFIVLYGGNFGKPQQIEVIFDLAEELSELEDVVFLFIGDGTEKKKMIDMVAVKSLKNIIIKDSMPRERYQTVAGICDIGLVNISEKYSIPNIPSRTLSYWEAGIPVLAAIDSYTDYGKILEDSGSGLWNLTGDLASYRENFMKLYNDSDLRKKMGDNGYNYLIKNCTTQTACKIINNKLTGSL